MLAEVALGCPQLQRISISNCSSVLDAGVRALAAGAPRLLAFVADDVGPLTDGRLLALGESCKSLQVSDPPHTGAEFLYCMCSAAGLDSRRGGAAHSELPPGPRKIVESV